MFYKSHFGTILTTVLSMFMGVVMACFIIFLNHLPFNWVNLFELTAEISLIVFVCSLFIPYNAWGDWFAGLFHLKEGSLAFKLVQGIIPSVVLNSANTFICTAASIFYNEAIPKAARVSVYLDGCKKAWFPCFVVSYIASFAAVWLGSKVAEKYAK
ncbi:hypothetical protein OCH80_01610 [Lactobacillus sp. 23-2]|uniref:hypothetical protein n=1 Tax=Lactobacillus sp. 23-2 TaxID=2981842 RepID=UPI003832D007